MVILTTAGQDAAALGFAFHHAEGGAATLLRWLPEARLFNAAAP